jgi:hypothetical protein
MFHVIVGSFILIWLSVFGSLGVAQVQTSTPSALPPANSGSTPTIPPSPPAQITAPAETVPRNFQPSGEVDAPPINKLSEDAKVTEYFAWKGIGGYKGESSRYQVEVLGTLSRGRFINKNTSIQKKMKGKWVPITPEKLKSECDYEFEFNAPDFAFRMNLTKGEYRIRVALFIDSETFEYDFEFETSDRWPPLPPPAIKLYLCQKCLTLGAGINYLNYQQTAFDDLDPINYSVFTTLPLSLESRIGINRRNAFRFEYHRQSANPIKAENINLQSPNINWSYMAIGGDSILVSNGKLFGISYSNGFMYGVQLHMVPFLRPVSGTEYTIGNFNLLSLGGGGFTGIRIHDTEVIVMMRMQVALSGQGDVKIKNGLSFDGSISYLKDISIQNMFWGLYWGGQYHSYKYELEGTGTYSLILSKIEGRFGYRF